MNLQAKTIASLVLAASGVITARAEGPMPESQWTAEVGKSRAEVIAERDAAIRDGAIVAMHGEDSGASWLSRSRSRSTVTRAQVQAELLVARTSGELNALHGEDSGSFHMARKGRVAADDQRFAQVAR